ncbi:hypothetical protein LSTR_LSTR004366 [Laodelphax striatellus]|uniref:GON-4-like protein n=1 Tax=Laodelphax striatellus TaxID=195883 RepID=A0A482X933_LAOST|nr:hypothetical protein LSTR_LSTR004366 [Laodelphax striatellus]
MENTKPEKSPSRPVWLFRSKDQTGTSQTGNLSFSFRLHNEDDDSFSPEGQKLTIDINEESIKSGLSRAEEPQSESVASTPDSKGIFSPKSKLPNVLDQVEGEIERQLDLKAEKSKLTVINVKKIIRDVIMNKDVISMVRQSMDDKKIEVPYEPKLTRAKARELMEKQALSVVWPLHEVPTKQTPCKSQILMEKEYPEDSSDEEYRPSEDEQSDDDDINKSSTMSVQEDLNLLERDEIFDNEGMEDTICEDESQPKRKKITFDLPPEPPTDEEPHSPSFIDDIVRENIGQRTRSKLCLSETPLEEIEQAFIPPDITCDMYDFNCDNDDWTNFLKEFTQPLDALPDMNETMDDVEADPEYNVLADEDTLTEDIEELRHDRGVKVSRREVKELIKELFEYTEMMSSQDKDKKKTQKSPVQQTPDKKSSAEYQTSSQSNSKPEMFSKAQLLLINQQLCQHVQLSTQHFLQTYRHPVLYFLADQAKLNVTSLKCIMQANQHSLFNIDNLDSALSVIQSWENLVDDPKTGEPIIKFMENEVELSDKSHDKLVLRAPKFPPQLLKLMCESDAFMYPLLLPPFPFYIFELPEEFMPSELNLLILGYDQFLPYVKNQRKWTARTSLIFLVAELLSRLLLPAHSPTKIVKYIVAQRKSKKNNPLKEYFKTNIIKPFSHHIVPINGKVKLRDNIKELMPHVFIEYLESERQQQKL